MLLQLLLFGAVFTASKANLQPTENYSHHADLDSEGKVMLFWKFNETHITFELHGNSVGWIGMGISPTGGMIGADIVVGWVKDGVAEITDRHAERNGFPSLDPEKNIELLDGMESDGWTMIKFRRQLAVCEPVYDMPITADTIKIIYAYGERDPEGEDITSSNYHGVDNRGVRSLILLGIVGDEDKTFPEGEIETHKTFDLLNDNFEIPSENTYYNCRLFKLPEFSEKQHVVKVEPVVQPGNEMFVHHIAVYSCFDAVNETLNLGRDVQCYSSNMPPDMVNCNLIMQAWAIGGTDIYYPNHAGFPLGEADSPKYVVMETHYDNPRSLSGTIDSSGLRFTYTNQLRQHDAGILLTGVVVNGATQLIPPNAESFPNYGECNSECLNVGMDYGNVEKINTFGVFLHAHLLGVGLTVRQFRNGIELPYLSKESSYDFNYQETRLFSKEVEIQKGDSLQVICNYKSKGVRTAMTTGGLDTTREMCEAFIYYYPKIPMHYCATQSHFQKLMKYFGIDRVIPTVPNFGLYNDINDLMIIKPENLQGQTVAYHLNSLNWNEETVQDFNDKIRTMERSEFCQFGEIFEYYPNVSAPVIDVPYKEEEQSCIDDSSPAPTASGDGEEFTTLMEEAHTTVVIDDRMSTASTNSVATTTKTISDSLETTTALVGDLETTTDGATSRSSSYWFCFLLPLVAMFLQ